MSSEIENESKMRSKIINAIINEKIVLKLLLDKYGNYGIYRYYFNFFFTILVIQKSLIEGDDNSFKVITNVIYF